MLSSCMRGQTGPERRYTGFGMQGAALSGFVAVTGWPDRMPSGPWGAYTDFIAPRYLAGRARCRAPSPRRDGRRPVHRPLPDRGVDPFPRADAARLRRERPHRGPRGPRFGARLPERRLRGRGTRALRRALGRERRAVAGAARAGAGAREAERRGTARGVAARAGALRVREPAARGGRAGLRGAARAGSPRRPAARASRVLRAARPSARRARLVRRPGDAVLGHARRARELGPRGRPRQLRRDDAHPRLRRGRDRASSPRPAVLS